MEREQSFGHKIERSNVFELLQNVTVPLSALYVGMQSCSSWYCSDSDETCYIDKVLLSVTSEKGVQLAEIAEVDYLQMLSFISRC